jgi:hypothetical protein
VRSPTTTSAPSAQGIGAVVVVVHHRSYDSATLTQQRTTLPPTHEFTVADPSGNKIGVGTNMSGNDTEA